MSLVTNLRPVWIPAFLKNHLPNRDFRLLYGVCGRWRTADTAYYGIEPEFPAILRNRSRGGVWLHSASTFSVTGPIHHVSRYCSSPYFFLHSHWNTYAPERLETHIWQHYKDPCCRWTDADDVILLCVLKEQKEAGNQSGAGWKSQVWTAVGLQVVATVTRAAMAATTKMVPCRRPFWRVSVAHSCERRLCALYHNCIETTPVGVGPG